MEILEHIELCKEKDCPTCFTGESYVNVSGIKLTKLQDEFQKAIQKVIDKK